MKKIIIFVGTRPEAIKLAPIILELKKFPAEINHLFLGTTHRLATRNIEGFGIACDYDLQVMQPGQNLTNLTRKIMACGRHNTENKT